MGKGAKERRAEVGMAGQQAAFLETEQLVFSRLGERAVGGVSELFVADAAVERGAGVAEYLGVDFGAELLGRRRGRR